MTELQEAENDFLQRLFNQTGGDTTANVSMYDIGETLSLERTAAKHVAEALIGMGLVEIRTLSGAIGITPEGIEAARGFQGLDGSPASGTVVLGKNRVADESTLQALEILLGVLKSRISDFALDLEDLSELMADLKSMDAQLMSPAPKTVVIRACLESIQDLLKAIGEGECLAQIKVFLGD